MRPSALLGILTLTVLTACNSSPSIDAKNASAGDVAKQVAANGGLRPNPGHWETTIKMEKMDIPGMPPQAQAMMQKSLNVEKKIASCLTAEEAAQPKAKFFGQMEKNCTYDHFTMGDGKIDAKMVCAQGQGKMTLAMNGTYDGDSYTMHTTSNLDMGAGRQLSSTMTTTAHRTGACDGKEDSHP